MFLNILFTICGLSLLVIVHEFGHYLAARYFGMRVTRFSIGFGPVLAKWQPKDSPTVFQVGALPFMAYVMIDGMNPADEVDPNDPALYSNKSPLARIITIFAGPFANYLAASLMIFGLAETIGWPEYGEPLSPMVVETVQENMPAAEAGLQPGDVIVEAEGQAITDVTDLIEVTKPRAGQPTTYVVERGGERLAPLTITPQDLGGRGVIGVSPKAPPPVYTRLPVGQAALFAIQRPWELTVLNLSQMANLVKTRSTEGIMGPVGMGKVVAEQAEKGLFEFIATLITISVAVGLFNLLPIPALDGGRLMFLAYEVITRRRPNERFEVTVHAVGLLFLLGVIVLVTLRDVTGG